MTRLALAICLVVAYSCAPTRTLAPSTTPERIIIGGTETRIILCGLSEPQTQTGHYWHAYSNGQPFAWGYQGRWTLTLNPMTGAVPASGRVVIKRTRGEL